MSVCCCFPRANHSKSSALHPALAPVVNPVTIPAVHPGLPVPGGNVCNRCRRGVVNVVYCDDDDVIDGRGRSDRLRSVAVIQPAGRPPVRDAKSKSPSGPQMGIHFHGVRVPRTENRCCRGGGRSIGTRLGHMRAKNYKMHLMLIILSCRTRFPAPFSYPLARSSFWRVNANE